MNMVRYILCTFIIIAVSLPSCSFLYGPAVDGQDEEVSFISPDELPGLAYWFAADREVTIDISNPTPNSVIYWKNLSGNNYDAAQATQVNQPILVENVLNGKPVIRFSGGQCLSYTADHYIGSSYTIFFAVRTTSHSALENYFIGGTGTTVNTNLMIGYRYSSPTVSFLHANWGWDLVEVITADTDGELFSCSFDANTSRSSYHNGTFLISSTDSNYTTPLSSYAGSTIGCTYFGISNLFFNGDIAEYIGYTRVLTESERQAVEAYLNNKYGLY